MSTPNVTPNPVGFQPISENGQNVGLSTKDWGDIVSERPAQSGQPQAEEPVRPVEPVVSGNVDLSQPISAQTHNIVGAPDGSKIAFPKNTPPAEMQAHVASWWDQHVQKAFEVVGNLIPDKATPALNAGMKYYVNPTNAALGKIGDAAVSSVQGPYVNASPKAKAYLRSQGINPDGPMPQWAQGINEATIRFASQTLFDPRMWPFFSEKLAVAAPSAARAILNRALAGTIASQASASTVEGLQNLSNNWDKLSVKERSEQLTGNTLSALMAGLTGYHAIHGTGIAQKPAEQAVEQTAPEQAAHVGPERRAEARRLMTPTAIEEAMNNRRMQDIQTPFDTTEGAADTMNRDVNARIPRITPDVRTATPNASGESAASQEAINRVASQKVQGIKTYRVDSRSGNAIPVIGVDAVDATAKPYEHIVQVNPKGDIQIQDSGAGARPLDEAKLMRQVAPDTVGSAVGATQDTALFQKAKAELGPDASISQIAARAQAMKTGAPLPSVKTDAATAGRSVGAASANDLNTKPDVPPFYSKAEQIINDKVSNNASGDSVKALLKNNGVKDDEMKWAGLDEFLKDKPKVSKAELQQFIKENQVSLEETNLGVKTRYTTQPNADETAHAGHPIVDVVAPNGIVRFTGDEDAAKDYMSELGQGLSSSEDRELQTLIRENSSIKAEQLRHQTELSQALRAARDTHGYGSPEASAAEDAFNDPKIRDEEFKRNLERIGDLEQKANKGATENPVKYDKWTIPGERENYQEKLLTLPSSALTNIPEAEAYSKFVEKMRGQYGDQWAQHLDGEEEETRRDLATDMRQALRDAKNANRYTAPHFHGAGENGETPENIVAHVRYDDRPAADGKKTLFMEEAQSDWHSEGRHSGYKADPKEIAAADMELRKVKDAKTAIVKAAADRVNADRVVNDFSAEDETELRNLSDQDQAFRREMEQRSGPISDDEQTAMDKRGDRIAELRHKRAEYEAGPLKLNPNPEIMSWQIRAAMTPEETAKFEAANKKVDEAAAAKAELTTGGVPDAPFKQSWHELVMKRMLRHAAENGYDRLAWTTGDQQADMYDLTKHIGKIEYDPENNELHAYNPQGKKVIDESVEPTVKDLAAYMGEDLAKKLVSKIEDYVVPSDDEDDYEEEKFNADAAWARAAENYYVDEREEQVNDGTNERAEYDQYVHQLARKYGYSYSEYPEFAKDIETPLFSEARSKLTPEEEQELTNLKGAAEAAEKEAEENPEYDARYYMVNVNGDDEGPFDSEREAERVRDGYIQSDVDYEAENFEPERRPREREKSDLPKIEGLDLKHGGEFHRLLYDKMIPSFLKKYAKKWGAEVGTTEIKGMGKPTVDYEGPEKTLAELQEILANGGPKDYALTHSGMQRLKEVITDMKRGIPFKDAVVATHSSSDSANLAGGLGGKFVTAPTTQKVHSIPITPAMRLSVMKEGQPIAKKEEKKRPFAAPQQNVEAANINPRLRDRMQSALA